eukprot:TRINITY_DN25406_c0_g1_i9.p1 TRINITY_DN25406_c0_g1~~TRINITY_DN25406_c0_g1_i9.p1  ORF type:complete len:126 (-),score=29.03 TRINITY_DN25406_c0_g1_i9:69-446(-)
MACSFAHAEEDLREKPDYIKTRLCGAFVHTGQCRKGSACKFAHGIEEMQSHAPAKHGSPKKQQVESDLGAMHAAPVPVPPASSLEVGVPTNSTLVSMPGKCENQPLPMCEPPDVASGDDSIGYGT